MDGWMDGWMSELNNEYIHECDIEHFFKSVSLLIQIVQICVFFTPWKLWVAVARHNFKWVKVKLFTLGL